MLLQAIGSRPEVKVAIGRLRLRRGDRFLLCCDGLSNAVTDLELAQTVATSDAPAACRALVDLANERGGKDNLTAVVAWVDGSDIDEPRTTETFDRTFEVLEAFSPSVP
jgi:serine/threonine protein phosphatase PrpC